MFSIPNPEFSSTEPTIATSASQVSVVAGRSDIECVVRCVSADASRCSSTVFAPESQNCLYSSDRDADFTAASTSRGGQAVFRRKQPASSNNATYTQVGDRLFFVMQSRSKGALSFQRNWTEYEAGFGDGTDFWIGLKTIASMTGGTPRLLRVETVTWANLLYVCEYSGFSVGSAGTNYTMTFAAYLSASSNTSSDSLTYHKGRMFSTIDVDNDMRSTSSCAQTLGGLAGWWFNGCLYCNPNGIYYPSAVIDSERAMHWVGVDGRNAVKSIRMMLQI